METYAFIDPGSSATFCSQALMNQLNMSGRKTEILLRTMGQKKVMQSYVLSRLEVCGLEEKDVVELPNVFTQNSIPVRRENIPLQKDIDRWSYLKEVRLPLLDADVGLLIRTNAHKAMEPWKVIHSQKDGPYAVKTALGWIINGPLSRGVNAKLTRPPCITANRISIATASVEELLVQKFNHDFPENKYDEKSEMSHEDHQFVEQVANIQFVDGHYCISLPLRKHDLTMPYNRNVAEQRLLNLKKRLNKNAAFLEDYKTLMDALIENGYAVKVPQELLNRKDGKV